jgi:5'-methylthioadenosine phosphorylase
MRERIAPLDLVIPDQFYDHTKRRVPSFFEEGIVAHVAMAEPVCPDLAAALQTAAQATGATVHRGGTYLCIEGPQFSTKAESRIYRSWGVDVIGMTNVPEVKLAREAELCYATLALVTDYDVWHETEAEVTVEAVIANLLKNVATAKSVLRGVIPRLGRPRTCPCPDLLRNAVITAPAAFPAGARRRLDLLIGKYFPLAPPVPTARPRRAAAPLRSPRRASMAGTAAKAERKRRG